MFSPFSLSISPMVRLFLINFEKDPDEIYVGFEPQWFDDASYGAGLRVIAWRKDGYVDVAFDFVRRSQTFVNIHLSLRLPISMIKLPIVANSYGLEAI